MAVVTKKKTVSKKKVTKKKVVVEGEEKVTAKTAVGVINEMVIGELFEAGVSGEPLMWERPWVVYPKQNISGKVYNKINSLLLSAVSDEFFLTFNQARELGAIINDYTPMYILNTYPINTPVSPEYILAWRESEIFIDNVRHKQVWHHKYTKLLPISQVSGVDEPIEKHPFIPRENIDGFIADLKLKIKEQGSVPHYDAITDTIIVPAKDRFASQGEWYHTLMEQIVALKAPKVLNDNDKEYARKELTVAIASAAVCLTFGITDLNKSTAAQVTKWIEYIKADEQLLLNASTRADRIVKELLK